MVTHAMKTPKEIEPGSEREKDFWWHSSDNDIREFLSESLDINETFLQNIRPAFDISKERSVSCVDGRTPEGALHLAGSGILLAEEHDEEIALATLRTMKLSAIYSHENCGAAALVAKLRGEDPHDGDRLGKAWAEYAAEALGIRYGGHLPVEPKRLHPERAIYIDGTGIFNISATSLRIPGFFVSHRYHQSPLNAMREVGLGITIALSDRGFGPRFTPDSPFILLIIGHPTEDRFSSTTIRKEVETLLNTDEIAKANRNRLTIRTFTPPTEWMK